MRFGYSSAAAGITPEQGDLRYQKRDEEGVANGYAPLDSSSKIPTGHLPTSGSSFKGVWNASTNTPNVGASSPSAGDFYKVSVAGTTSLSGITNWGVGDEAVYNGSVWQRIPSAQAITTVFGRTGAVFAQSGDYSADKISAATHGSLSSTNIQDQVHELEDEKQALLMKDQANGYAGLDASGRLAAPAMGSGSPDSTKVLFGDKVWRPPGGPASAANLAGLRARTSANNNEVVEALGYDTAGDGGGGSYRADTSDTTSAESIPDIIVGGSIRYKLRPSRGVDIRQFGAKPGGVIDATAAINAAIDRVNARGGGDVWGPPERFRVDGNIQVKSNVTFLGGEGSRQDLDIGHGPAGMTFANFKAPMLVCTSTTQPAMTMRGNAPCVRGWTFYYPNQAAYTASTPVGYPPTINLSTTEYVGGPTVERCFFINSYTAIDFTTGAGGGGRPIVRENNIDAIAVGIIIDGHADVPRIEDNHIWPFYSFATGSGGGALAAWTQANGYGLIIRRADWAMLSNHFCYGRYCGVWLADSPYTTGVWAGGRSSSGIGQNVHCDASTYGVIMSSGAWQFTNMIIYVWNGANIGVQTVGGGTVTPHITLLGGTIAGPMQYAFLHQAGSMMVSNWKTYSAASAAAAYYGGGATYLNLHDNQFAPGSPYHLAVAPGAAGRLSVHDNEMVGATASNASLPAGSPSGGRKIKDNWGVADQ